MFRPLAPLVGPVFLAGAVLALEGPASGNDGEIRRLVADLGNKDFATREAAAKQLETLGEPALDPLRPACRSSDPEVARRAQMLVARVERRLDNERTLAPTLVELNVEKKSLREVLADLSKQSGYRLSLDASPASDEDSRVVTVKGGKLAFWEAVLQVCDAAELQISSVSGYISPGSRMLPTARPQPQQLPTIGGRTSRRTRNAVEITSSPNIVLEPRGKEPKRPTAVFGGVLVEAFPAPLAASTPGARTALLQIWPEPKLHWQEVKGLYVDRAKDSAGQLLTQVMPEAASAVAAVVHQGAGVVIIQQANGGVVLVNDASASARLNPRITLNPRQTLVKLKPGPAASDQLKDLTGAIHGTVRSKPEPLVKLKGMKPGEQAEGSHPAGIEMKATLTRNASGVWQAVVELSYDQSTILPSDWRADSGLVDIRASAGGVAGIRVFDADGESFEISPTGSRTAIRGIGRMPGGRNQIIRGFTFSVLPREGSRSTPEGISFWGSYPKGVEIPFELAGIPVSEAR